MQTSGFLFATTGPKYTALAQRAAQSVRQHCPDIPIDLFTDQDIVDGTFDQIHMLDHNWFRPKMEALYRSRFEHTVYLDADLFVTADISDIFEVLGRFDCAASHDQYRNSPAATQLFRRPIPAAFPQLNGGILGITRNERTQAFLKDWERVLRESGAEKDQSIFRELLFDSDLTLSTLPSEYNVHRIEHLRALTSDDGAPRVIHHHFFHQHFNLGHQSIHSVEDLLGKRLFQHLQKLIAADTALFPNEDPETVDAYCDVRPGAKIPSPYRIKQRDKAKQRLKHPFRGTYGESAFKAFKNFLGRKSE